MWFDSSAVQNSMSQSDMTLNNGADTIQPVTRGRDLGVYYSELIMRMHISKDNSDVLFSSATPKTSPTPARS